MNSLITISVFALFLLFGVYATNADQISASSSGHYVQYSGKVIMLVGDSGTQCVMQNLNLDYRQWIDDCAKRSYLGAGSSPTEEGWKRD